MLPQAYACVDEKHFEIVDPTFSNTVGEFRKLFSSVWIAFIFGKLADFIYKRSLVITEAVCCDIFESFCNGGKAKIPRRVVYKLVSPGLYYACTPADIVPLILKSSPFYRFSLLVFSVSFLLLFHLCTLLCCEVHPTVLPPIPRHHYLSLSY